MDHSQKQRAQKLVKMLKRCGANHGVLAVQGNLVVRDGVKMTDDPFMFQEADLQNAVALGLLEKRKIDGPSGSWEWYVVKSGELKMGTITINSRKESGIIRVEVDTTQGGISAWTKDFPDAKDVLNLFLKLAPTEAAKIRDFVTTKVNFGEGHIVIPCEEQDFSKYGFEKLPPA